MLHALQKYLEDRTSLRGAIELTGFNLTMIFAIMCVLGLIFETLVSCVPDGCWKDRSGLVWGPFSPIYGLGAVVMTIVLNEIHDRNPLLLVAVGGAFGGALEYFGGWLLENWYGIVAWSYADQPFNFYGHTSLFMCIVWGCLGVAWVKLLLGPVMSIVDSVPEGARKPLYYALVAFFVVDISFTIASWEFWYERTAGLPVQTPVQQFFAVWFNDAFMASKFQTMSMWPSLALWR